MSELICDYCNVNVAVGVYAADHGPFSLAQCEECLKHPNLRTIGNGLSKWGRFGESAFSEYKDLNGSEPKVYFNGEYMLLRDFVTIINEDHINSFTWISDILKGQILDRLNKQNKDE